jgi:hypothetical protein
LTVHEKAPSEAIWKTAREVLAPSFGDTTAVIKIVDPEKMRMFIHRVPTSNAGIPPKGVYLKPANP